MCEEIELKRKDYYALIHLIVAFIERRISNKRLDYRELEKISAFSIEHIRDVFVNETGISLDRYFKQRKVICSAFDLVNTNQTIVDIAMQYGFSNHDTYTRTFKRIVGILPSQFRECAENSEIEELLKEINSIKLDYDKNTIIRERGIKDSSAVIIYDIDNPFLVIDRNPFVSCIVACAKHMGVDTSYERIMVETGCAFRFNWRMDFWFLGNVDVRYIYDEGPSVFEIYFNERECMIGRAKKDYQEFVVRHINQGIPCIATGVIGPPEACIITGYARGGEVLYGWNAFQYDQCYSGKVAFDKRGYYITSNWWENGVKEIMAFTPLVEIQCVQDILKKAYSITRGREYNGMAKGQYAFSIWRANLLEDRLFSEKVLIGDLCERLGVHVDAIRSLLDARKSIINYFKNFRGEFTSLVEIYGKVIICLDRLNALIDWEDGLEVAAKRFASKDVRIKSAHLIMKVEQLEMNAREQIAQLLHIG